MACPTSSECWLLGDTVRANPVRILDEGEVLLSSANGGRTWERRVPSHEVSAPCGTSLARASAPVSCWQPGRAHRLELQKHRRYSRRKCSWSTRDVLNRLRFPATSRSAQKTFAGSVL